MIRREKFDQALRALNSILIRARFLAGSGNTAEVADLLDAAEILPKYIAQPEDATELFRSALQSISSEHISCSHIIEEFDRKNSLVW
jgi:hypothetical protein